MHFIAFCVAIIALANLPEALRVVWDIICGVAKVIGYLLMTAFIVGVFVWII